MRIFKVKRNRSSESKSIGFPAIHLAWTTTRSISICLAIAAFWMSGCGGYSASRHRVESTTARSTLDSVLKSWQAGAAPESWQEKKPKVVIQDFDWKAGTKLHSFEILGDGDAVDANLYCKVKLQLETPDKGKSEKTVTYLIGTSPVLTVFRSVEP